MKRLQGGKVVDFDPFQAVVVADDVPDGSISDVLDWVGEDEDRKAQALEAEQAKESPRSTLVDKLS